MQLKTFRLGMLQANSHLFYDENSKNAIIFDVGGDAKKVVSFLEENGLTLKYIIITHGHCDHIGGVVNLKEKTGAEIIVHSDDADMIENPKKNLSTSFAGVEISVEADIMLTEDCEMDLGGINVKFYHTPGHTPGGICAEVGDYLVTGDTLFRGSIGRTDLNGGSFTKLQESLNKLKSLNPNLVVLPGHEGSSTIANEIKTNPYLR